MKIRHGNLERLRRNPMALLTMSDSGGWNRTVALYYAVRICHQDHPDKGLRYLETYLASRPMFGNDVYLAYYERYVASFQAQGHIAYDFQRQIDLALGSGIELGGRIERLDLVPSGGYAAWLFQIRPRPRRWGAYLRMPLLQRAVADSLGTAVDQVSIGMYWFDPDEYNFRSYSEAEIKEAMREAEAVARQISSLTR